jgi:hypothetical protein
VSAAEPAGEAQLGLLSGVRWLRSSGYHIEAGLIRLEPGAPLELYDPWEAWRAAADEERPYKRLLRLAQQLQPPRLQVLPRRQQQQLESWVRENGLLGILPHETLEATMAARWVDEQRFWGSGPVLGAGSERRFVPAQRQQLWENGRWPVYWRRVGAAHTSDPAREGELVAAEDLGGAGLPLEVLRRRVIDAGLERCPLAEHYQGFFPQVPRAEAWTHAYPGVDTEPFWRGYAESAFQFVATARYLAAPLEGLERLRAGQLSERERTLIGRALTRISAIASVVDFAGALGQGDEFIVGWSAPSLLGMYALMLLTDLKAGHLVKRCPNCEVFFLARNPRARYCSSTCRHAQQKREWRKAKAQRQGAGEADASD